MRYAVTIATSAGRLLVPTPRPAATLRDARAWLSRMAATWCDALQPVESGFTGLVLDDDGSAALTVDYGRDPDIPPVESDRDELHEMKKTTTRGSTR